MLGHGTHRRGILVQPGVELKVELKWQAHFCLVPGHLETLVLALPM